MEAEAILLPCLAGVCGALVATVVGLTWQHRQSARQERATRAMVAAGRTLGAAADPFAAMPEALAGLGQAFGWARFELHAIHATADGGTPLSTIRASWAAPGVADRIVQPDLRDRPWHPERTRWLTELAAGRSIAATARELTPAERADLIAGGSIMLAPVMVAGRLWGCLMCCDRADRRDHADSLALQQVAELIATAISGAAMVGQLSAARAEAAAGERAKREFIANISHEVRTPLNGVLGMSGLLLDTELDTRQREYAQVVRTSAENLLALLNDLIDLAKSEGEQRVERVRFDPLRMAEDVVAMLAERAHAKSLEIAVHPCEGLPRLVVGDATRLRQVLVNLVGNAIKFTLRGSVVVRVDWRDGHDDGKLIYDVCDTGIGIDAVMQSRLFATFLQGDGSTTRRFGGTGLGLAICKRLIEIVGGSVTCRSALGEGSTFSVTVPCPEITPVAANHTSRLPRSLLGARVLVIDADPAIREAMVAVCERIGLVAEQASGCGEAAARIAAIGSEAPRLALVPSNLPGASDLPARLKPSGVTCILLSTLARRPQQAEAIRLGFAACLVKPPRTARLAEVVGRALHPSEEGSSGRETVAHRRTTMRVLVVEDDAINQRLAKAVLERDGVRCDVAGDGHEALEALARAHYDAVLMDLLMPVMDGCACTREIRRLERERGDPPILILAVTALDEADMLERCREAGMDGQVRKPFEPRHLRRVLRRMLQERRQVG